MWLFDILTWFWNNLYWILPLGCFIFFFGLIRPVRRTVHNIKDSFTDIFSFDGFIIFIILMALALFLSGLLASLF